MKNILLTWYGLTDLRASLGFGSTDGPIVGALVAESYSDVVILGHTRSDDDSCESIKHKKTFHAELAAIHTETKMGNWGAVDTFISSFANTTAAHKHFLTWLEEKAASMGSGASIRFNSEKLRKLNDTEGIYACAMRALDLVEKEPGDKMVTLYLSPGTPVMAFIWAFAALNHPDLKKRLIASPVIGKPPEVIALPAEWLEQHVTKQEMFRASVDEAGGFDVTFHLFGEQRMPALLSIRQFASAHHIFVNTKDYPAACMQAFLDSCGCYELPVNPWDDRAVYGKITELAKQFPDKTRIGINLTGGTKLMFAGALSAARALGAVPFYFDSRNRRVTFIDSLRREIIKPIDSIEPFLRVNSDGLDISDHCAMKDMSPDRKLLTDTLWQYRGKIRRFYKELVNYSNDNELKPFEINEGEFYFSLNSAGAVAIKISNLDLAFEHWPDFAKYLSGGWFEEYVYLQCKPYEDSGLIRDMRINLKLNLKNPESEGDVDHSASGMAYNELDITFTDGYSLYIVECKAGNVTQEQVMKLQNLVRIYGGVEGRGILACCVPPKSESIKKKIKDARLTLWQGTRSWPFPVQVKALMEDIAVRAQSTGTAA